MSYLNKINFFVISGIPSNTASIHYTRFRHFVGWMMIGLCCENKSGTVSIEEKLKRSARCEDGRKEV